MFRPPFKSIISFADPDSNFGLKIMSNNNKNKIIKKNKNNNSKKNNKKNNIIDFTKYKKN